MPLSANIVLRNFGLAIFLAQVGISAGPKFFATIGTTGITFLLLRMRLQGGEGLSPDHRKVLERVAEGFARMYPEGAPESPIMLFRLGLASPPSGRALRLPLEQVLEIAPSAP